MKCSLLCCAVVLLALGSGVLAEHHENATSAPTESSSHISMICTSGFMEATIDRKKFANLDSSNLHLNDAGCTSTEVTDDLIRFRTKLDGCGTTHNVSSDGKYLVYYNSITGDLVSPTTDTVITREHQVVMPFQCSYDRVVVLSRQAYTPKRAVVYTRTESFGNFTFTMDLYKTDEYEETYEDFPLEVATGQRLYLEVSVVSNTSSLSIVPIECKATPTDGYSDKPHYVFINESCGQDKTLQYDHKEGRVQRFSIASFRFLPDFNDVYLHCRVTACPKGVSNSRCAVGCKDSDSSSRRRRATLVQDIEQEMSLGPVSLNDKQSLKPAQSAWGSGSMVTMVTIIAAVLGVLVLSLIIAVVIVMKRKSPAKSGNLLVVDEA